MLCRDSRLKRGIHQCWCLALEPRRVGHLLPALVLALTRHHCHGPIQCWTQWWRHQQAALQPVDQARLAAAAAWAWTWSWVRVQDRAQSGSGSGSECACGQAPERARLHPRLPASVRRHPASARPELRRSATSNPWRRRGAQQMLRTTKRHQRHLRHLSQLQVQMQMQMLVVVVAAVESCPLDRWPPCCPCHPLRRYYRQQSCRLGCEGTVRAHVRACVHDRRLGAAISSRLLRSRRSPSYLPRPAWTWHWRRRNGPRG